MHFFNCQTVKNGFKTQLFFFSMRRLPDFERLGRFSFSCFSCFLGGAFYCRTEYVLVDSEIYSYLCNEKNGLLAI